MLRRVKTNANYVNWLEVREIAILGRGERKGDFGEGVLKGTKGTLGEFLVWVKGRAHLFRGAGGSELSKVFMAQFQIGWPWGIDTLHAHRFFERG